MELKKWSWMMRTGDMLLWTGPGFLSTRSWTYGFINFRPISFLTLQLSALQGRRCPWY
jgi:hypothetical protein